MWRMVGTCVVVTATGIPLRTGAGELICMRRGQAVLDALTTLACRCAPCPHRHVTAYQDRAGELRAAATPGSFRGRTPRHARGSVP
jgi:hypothetical protein